MVERLPIEITYIANMWPDTVYHTILDIYTLHEQFQIEWDEYMFNQGN